VPVVNENERFDAWNGSQALSQIVKCEREGERGDDPEVRIGPIDDDDDCLMPHDHQSEKLDED
jgi:hypothetical protein